MAQFASDGFTNTAGTELTAHSANFVKHGSSGAGTVVISAANRGRHGVDAESIYYHTGSPASANYTVSMDLYVASAAGNNGLLGRVDTAANTYYMARYDFGPGAWQLYKRVAGTFTQLGSNVTQALSTSTSYNLKLSMSGTTIELYKEGSGTPSISVTDSAISAAGKAGLRENVGGGSDSVQIHIDNFSADDIGAAAASLIFQLTPIPPALLAM